MRGSMRVTLRLAAVVPLTLALGYTAAVAHEPGECDAFTWNVSRELAAMRTRPTLLNASADPRLNLVHLEEGRHFTARLAPQQNVRFVAPPAHDAHAEHPTGGLLFFRSAGAGAYRISLTSRHWIDVLDGDRVIGSRAHEGRRDCTLLHKVVEFELPAAREFTIQLSGADDPTVEIVITAVRG